MNHSREITLREFVSQLVILVALLVLTFPNVFFRGELLSSADLLFLIMPWSEYAPDEFEHVQNQLMFDPVMAFRPDYLLTKRSLENGEWPTWNPWEYAGVPLLANCQSTVFYPLRLLMMVVDLDTAMTAWVILKLLLCGITAFVCGRLLKLSLAASRFFSIAWMLCSYNLIWANWPLVDVSAWLPILFVGADYIVENRYRRGFFTLALGGTLILYAGHPETAFTMSMGVGSYFIARLALDHWQPLRRPANLWRLFAYVLEPIARTIRASRTWTCIGVSLAAWALALFVYAPQLLPFAEFLTHSYTWSERHEEEDFYVSYRAGAAACLWVPRFFGTNAEDNFWDQEKWNSNIMGKQYPGMVVWCGIAVLLLKLPPNSPLRRRNKQIAAILFAGTISLLLAYHFWPLNLIGHLPVFGSMLEIYHICFAIFAMPLLAAIGIERWLAQHRSVRELLPIAVLGIAAAATVYGVYLFNADYIRLLTRSEQPELADYLKLQVGLAILFFALSAALFALSVRLRKPALFWTLAALIFAADHWIAVRGFNPTMPRDQVYPHTKLTDFMAGLPKPARFGVAQANIYNGAIANYELEEWMGYDGLFPERVIRYQSELKDTVWKAMEPAHSIAYYLNDPDPRYEPTFPHREMLERGDLEWLGRYDGLEVYRNLGAYPRAYLVGNLEVVPERDELLERMKTPGFVPKRLALTEVSPSLPLPATDAENVGDARVLEHNFTSVEVQYNATEDAVLVLADAYYPGWNAYLDGRPVEIFPVFYMFRGIIVPPGEHTVTYRYEPLPLRIGLAMSTFAMLASAVACVVIIARPNPIARAGA